MFHENDNQSLCLASAGSTHGLVGMYMVNCIHPETGEASVCSTDYYVQDGFLRRTLYEGESSSSKVVDLNAGADDDLSASFIGDFGGLQMSLKYIEFDLADSILDEDYQGLEGATFRYCLVNQASVNSAELVRDCGNAGAKRGDLLVDLNGDGNFVFFSLHLWVMV